MPGRGSGGTALPSPGQPGVLAGGSLPTPLAFELGFSAPKEQGWLTNGWAVSAGRD